MNKVSLARLTSMSATQILDFYENPGTEIKPPTLNKSVSEMPRDTERYLAMSCMVTLHSYQFYLSFDEVVLHENKAYLIIRKFPRTRTTDFHLEKCLNQVSQLGSCFEASNKNLVTVKVLIDAGFEMRKLDLSDKECVYVLEYDGDTYDVGIGDHAWSVAKMNAINGGHQKAQSFDDLALPVSDVWDI